MGWKLARENPVNGIKFFSEGTGRTQFLTSDEAERSIVACGGDFGDVVLIALHRGCPRSEITSLACANVDLVQRTFTVLACYAKNGQTETLPMTDELYEKLQRRSDHRDHNSEDLVFFSRYNRPSKSWKTA